MVGVDEMLCPKCGTAVDDSFKCGFDFSSMMNGENPIVTQEAALTAEEE